MRIPFRALIILLLLASGGLSFAQGNFYNRDSSGYTYRIGPVLPKIDQDWQLGSLGRDFTFGFNPSGVNIENYVQSLLNLPDVRTALQASVGTDVFQYLLLQSFQNPTEDLGSLQCDVDDESETHHSNASRRSSTASAWSRSGRKYSGRRAGAVRSVGCIARINFSRVGGEALFRRFRRSIPRHHGLRHAIHHR